LSIGPTAITATGSVTLAMALGLFGKRRRDGQQPGSDQQLAAAAARGLGSLPFPRPVPGQEGTLDPDAGVPRWLRPSLLQARRADPRRQSTVDTRLTFSEGSSGSRDQRERRLIRHHIVRMFDAPDELRGSEVGYLGRDDEVELIERRGPYWLVQCPNGLQGWIHNMTLGEVIDETPVAGPRIANIARSADAPTPTEEDEDASILQAYMEARRLA
jgi:hypothetical protein